LLPVLPSVVGAALMLDGLAVLPSLLWAPAIDMPAISAAAAVMVVSVFISSSLRLENVAVRLLRTREDNESREFRVPGTDVVFRQRGRIKSRSAEHEFRAAG